jgi:hypothetical protein
VRQQDLVTDLNLFTLDYVPETCRFQPIYYGLLGGDYDEIQRTHDVIVGTEEGFSVCDNYVASSFSSVSALDGARAHSQHKERRNGA